LVSSPLLSGAQPAEARSHQPSKRRKIACEESEESSDSEESDDGEESDDSIIDSRSESDLTESA